MRLRRGSEGLEMGPKIAVEGAPGTQWEGIQGTGPALTALYSYCRLRAVTSAMAARGTGPGTGVGPGKGAGTGAGPDEAAPQPRHSRTGSSLRRTSGPCGNGGATRKCASARESEALPISHSDWWIHDKSRPHTESCL